MSVRIAAHAITALLLAPVSGASASEATSATAPFSAVVPSSIEEQQALRSYDLGIDHGSHPGAMRILADAHVIDTLIADGWPIEGITPPLPPPPEGYRLPEAGGELLRALADAGERVGHAVIGHSVEGRAIEAVWIGQPPESGAPVHRILGGHHGDEYPSFEVALATAEALAAGDGTDPAITALLDAVTIWIVPYVNPDGVQAALRFNANGVDLNRNYDFQWNPEEYHPGPAAFSEPETRAVRSLSSWVQPILGLSLHAGATNLGYPWNYTLEPAADVDRMAAEADRYAATTTLQDFWVTNGAAWYISCGDTNDWSYGRHGTWDYTLELTTAKIPDPSEIPGFIDDHLPAVLDFVSILPDLSATLRGPEGEPIDAEIQLLSQGMPFGQPFRTEPGTGALHHLLDPQVTGYEARADGYHPATTALGSDALPMAPDAIDGRPFLPAPLNGQGVELPFTWTGAIVLRQPGHPDRAAIARDGLVSVLGDALAAGVWTAIRSDGPVHPRAILVSSAERTQLDGLVLPAPTEDSIWRIDGTGFVSGTRVWALYGEHRARVPVPVVEQTDDMLRLDAAAVPETDRVDLWILSGGEHLFLADIWGIDPETWSSRQTKPRLVGRACACEVKTGHLPGAAGSWILTVLLLLSRRHRR